VALLIGPAPDPLCAPLDGFRVKRRHVFERFAALATKRRCGMLINVKDYYSCC